MTEAMDRVGAEIAALREVVGKQDRSTVDLDKLAQVVRDAVALQVSAALDASASRPVFRGEVIGPPGFASVSRGVVESGKFAGMPVEDLLFVRGFLQGVARLEPSAVKAPSRELNETLEKALSATGTGTGDELVPTGMASQLWADSFLASKVVQALGPVQMPTDPWDWPLVWGALTWRKGAENTQTTPQEPATAKSTFTATEQIVEVDWSYNLDEDSVAAVLPSLKAELARSAGEQMDSFVLNADSTATATGNINSDDAAPGSDHYSISNGQDGIRHLWLVDNTGQGSSMGGALTDAGMRAGLAKLAKYAATPSRCLIVMDPWTYVSQLLGLTNVVTVDKFGPSATILTGQLASYSGAPVIVSESLSKTAADGKADSATPANNTKGQINIFNRDMWKVAFRRQLLIEVDKDIKKRQFVMVVSFREAVGARGTRSSATHTAGIYNITV